MFNIFKLFGICFLVCCCSFQEAKKTTQKSTGDILENECKIPLEIETYLKSNSAQWSKLEQSDFNRELLTFLSDAPDEKSISNCPHFVFGDFTNDGKEDFAIILKNRTYKVDEYDNYEFPFLVVFNNYEDSIVPHIVYKTGPYKNETVKTVVYSDSEQGVLSYLGNGNVCGMNVINVTYFEKSGFFVFWDELTNSYRYLNYLDENLCEKVKVGKFDSSKLIGSWSNQCEYEQTEFNIGDKNEVFLSLQSDNAICINCFLELVPQKKETYNLFFKSVASQKHYYADKKNIIESDISKKERIATIKIINDDTFELDWKGLYNLKTEEIDFAKDFVFLIENNNISPIVLKKCKE